MHSTKDSINDQDVDFHVQGSCFDLTHSYLNLKGEILFHILDDHHKVGKLDPQCLLWV